MGKKIIKRKGLFSKIRARFFINCNKNFAVYHIVPKSKMKEIIYGDYLNKVGGENISKLPKTIHDDFRRLFPDFSPPEILAILVTKFWGGQIHWLNKYMKEPEKYDNSPVVKSFYINIKNTSSRKPHNRTYLSTHHIVPSSRLSELEYSVYNQKLNTTMIARNLHDYYHWIFINLTPPEIVAILVNSFWRGQIFWVKFYLRKSYFFNSRTLFVD